MTKAKRSLLALANAVRRKRNDEGVVVIAFDGDSFEAQGAWRNLSAKRRCQRILMASIAGLEGTEAEG